MNKEQKRQFKRKLKRRLDKMFGDCMSASMVGESEMFCRHMDDFADWVLEQIEESHEQTTAA